MENKRTITVSADDKEKIIYVDDSHPTIDGTGFTAKKYDENGDNPKWHPAFYYPERIFNLPKVEMTDKEKEDLVAERDAEMKDYKYSEDGFQKEAV
jgi:hypothetical protein